MAFPLPLDPTPASVEALASTLPASLRAALIWFPIDFRRVVVDRLTEVPDRVAFDSAIDEVSVDGVRLLFRLAHETAGLVSDPAVSSLLTSSAQAADTGLILTRLEHVDRIAARDLREAYKWLRAITRSLFDEFNAALRLSRATALVVPELTEGDLRNELRGTSGTFLRGVVLTAAAIDLVQSPRALPPTVSRWCQLALRDLQAAANSLRAEGISVPTAVDDLSAATSSSLRSDVLPPGVRARLVDTFDPEEIWLFGSRARGTHGPWSDWDLLVVVDDDWVASDESTKLVSNLRRERIDIFVAQRAEVESGRSIDGSLANIALSEGRRLHAR